MFLDPKRYKFFVKRFSERTIVVIFRNKETLDPTFIPEQLLHRQNEIKALARNFKGLFRDSLAGNSTIVAILGGPGQGKTALAMFTLRRLLEIAKNRNINIIGNYKNCWTYRSATAILSQVVQSIIGSDIKTKGISTEEVGDILRTYLIEENAHLILILDDINAIPPEDINSFFVLQEQYSDSRISFILISRPTEWHIMAPHLNTRLNESFILYPYPPEDTLEIVKYRVNLAFEPNTLEDGVIELISDICFDNQNIRIGMELLMRAGEQAEKAQKLVSSEDIRAVRSLIYPELRTEVLQNLQKHELLTLLGIARRLSSKGFTQTTIVEAYKYYCRAAEEWGESSNGLNSFRSYLMTLKSLGLINVVVSAIRRRKRGVRAKISISDVPAMIVAERIVEQLDLIEKL